MRYNGSAFDELDIKRTKVSLEDNQVLKVDADKDIG